MSSSGLSPLWPFISALLLVIAHAFVIGRMLIGSQVYQRCRDSVSEFNDISKEVNLLHMVLEAIETHWKENRLDSKTGKNLGVHTEGCIESLRDLEAILDKHKSLGMVKKRKIERLKVGMPESGSCQDCLS